MPKALHIHLEAKPGKGPEVETLLADILAIARDEPATAPWTAVKMSDTVYGIFETFPDEAGRQAHLNGKGAALLKQRQDALLVSPARSTCSTSWAASRAKCRRPSGRRPGPGRSRSSCRPRLTRCRGNSPNY